MGKYTIPTRMINLIKQNYEGYTCQAVHKGKTTTPISTIKEVK